MKVNMTPNPLDVVTIHASQGDTEARQWEFELHNNGELIDTSDVKEQMVFKSYKGGTEQILPENGSTPTTSPFLGDIRYPQGLLTNQEFTYRQSPTEEDGLAKITDIKGNTLVWNQLIENGNFADTSQWSAESGATLSISNNIATISSTTANNGIRQYFSNPLTVNHKYLIKAEFNVPTEYRCVIGTGSAQGVQIEKLISTANTWTEVIGIGTCTASTTAFYCFVRGTTYENVKIRNVMCFDLTQMGLDITDPSEFTSLFPLSYYSYNQGSLLSFMGNGIKTVGFNQWDEEWEVGGLSILNGVPVAGSSQIRSKNFCPLIGGKTYYMTCGKTDGGSQNRFYLAICFYDDEQKFISATYANNLTFVAPSNASYFKLTTNSSTVVYGNTYNNDICINISSSRNGTYEPYTSSTLSLPISTYFPTGMKSAGTVYDELTESKAITRIGVIDLGSLTWRRETGTAQGHPYVRFRDMVPGIKSSTSGRSTEGLLCSNPQYFLSTSDSNYTYWKNTTSEIFFYNDAYADAAAFKTAMSGVYLYYELATPTETSFTTASLVTENAEIPLSNEDGTLIGKCTEQLSENPGFIDAKIKLSDADGECYSNKIQLHVERKPS